MSGKKDRIRVARWTSRVARSTRFEVVRGDEWRNRRRLASSSEKGQPWCDGEECDDEVGQKTNGQIDMVDSEEVEGRIDLAA